MIVYIGADHRGYQLKEKLKEWLKDEGKEVVDAGKREYDPKDDYSEVGIGVGEKVIREKGKGILLCGSGAGVCIAANKVKGIRAMMGINEKQVRLAREDDDVNVLCLAADYIEEEEAKKMIIVFLETVFAPEERHIRRLNQIRDYETKLG